VQKWNVKADWDWNTSIIILCMSQLVSIMCFTEILVFNLYLEKGKAFRKHCLHGKIAASVLLKLFTSGNKRCYTTDAPYRMSEPLLLNKNNRQFMIPEDQNNITIHWCSTQTLKTVYWSLNIFIKIYISTYMSLFNVRIALIFQTPVWILNINQWILFSFTVLAFEILTAVELVIMVG